MAESNNYSTTEHKDVPALRLGLPFLLLSFFPLMEARGRRNSTYFRWNCRNPRGDRVNADSGACWRALQQTVGALEVTGLSLLFRAACSLRKMSLRSWHLVHAWKASMAKWGSGMSCNVFSARYFSPVSICWLAVAVFFTSPWIHPVQE